MNEDVKKFFIYLKETIGIEKLDLKYLRTEQSMKDIKKFLDENKEIDPKKIGKFLELMIAESKKKKQSISEILCNKILCSIQNLKPFSFKIYYNVCSPQLLENYVFHRIRSKTLGNISIKEDSIIKSIKREFSFIKTFFDFLKKFEQFQFFGVHFLASPAFLDFLKYFHSNMLKEKNKPKTINNKFALCAHFFEFLRIYYQGFFFFLKIVFIK